MKRDTILSYIIVPTAVTTPRVLELLQQLVVLLLGQWLLHGCFLLCILVHDLMDHTSDPSYLAAGNTMYVMAYDMNSITVLLLGQLFFCGFGSARAVNRRREARR